MSDTIDSGANLPAIADTGAAMAELADIREMRNTNWDGYISNKVMLQREVDLIDVELDLKRRGHSALAPTGAVSGKTLADLSEQQAVAVLPPDLVDEWERDGDVTAGVALVQRDIGNVLANLPVSERGDLVAQFDSLPEQVRTNVFRELGAGRPNLAVSATPQQLAAFQASEAGAVLVARWGRGAPQKVATLQIRLDTILRPLHRDHQARALSFFDDISLSQAIAVLDELVA